MLWAAVQKYSTMVISFISGIILARLLMPEDYGAIGMMAIFMSLAEVFIDAGFGSAFIQKKEPTQTDYSTVFYFNIGMSVILYAVLSFTAPAIADFYRMPIQSILPVNNKDFSISCNNKQILRCSQQIEALSSKYGLQFLDTYSAYQRAGEMPKEMTIDGLHLKPEYYKVWYEMLKYRQKWQNKA